MQIEIILCYRENIYYACRNILLENDYSKFDIYCTVYVYE